MIIKLKEQEIGIVDTGKFYKIIKVRVKKVQLKTAPEKCGNTHLYQENKRDIPK